MATRKSRKPASERPSGGTILFTGFPGFIGARLIPRLLELRPGASFECLVQEKFLGRRRRLGCSPRGLAPAHEGPDPSRDGRHHGARPRPRRRGREDPREARDGLLPPRGRLRPRGREGRRDRASTSRARRTSSSSSRTRPASSDSTTSRRPTSRARRSGRSRRRTSTSASPSRTTTRRPSSSRRLL